MRTLAPRMNADDRNLLAELNAAIGVERPEALRRDGQMPREETPPETPVPVPTPIVRFMHIDNLAVCLERGGLHAPNHQPDWATYKTIHDANVQKERAVRTIRCAPGGVIHDYVAFYFGPLSPMMLQLKTGQVAGYSDGQDPLIYLVSQAQAVDKSGADFVFSDGHGIATFTEWFNDLKDLAQVDWDVVNQRYWSDTLNDMDRQRRKQAEFLIHKVCKWSLISEIVVMSKAIETRVDAVLDEFPECRRPVVVRRDWYYW